MHALIGGDQDRAAPVSVGHQPEEQAGLGPVHGLKAQLNNEQESGLAQQDFRKSNRWVFRGESLQNGDLL